MILKGKHRLFLAASGEAALKIAADQKIDLAYLDIRMPGLDGIETLTRLREIDPALEIIMVTAVNDVQKASQAIRRGARDYVVKPFDVARIQKLTEQAILKRTILLHGLSAQRSLKREEELVLGQSQKIKEIHHILKTIKEDEKVLILGEAGTEKEALARLVHTSSKERDFPFKALYLSHDMSFPEIKALLFGKESGQSTVEMKAQAGILEEARGGSVFIDNLECLPEEILKVLSEKQFTRLGGDNLIPLEARLIGGGAPDLFSQKRETFEFFSQVLLELPPLRERITDLPQLIEHYLDKYARLYGKNVVLSPLLSEALTGYSWPGNIRELENVLRKLVAFAKSGEIHLEDIPFDILLKGPGSPGSDFLIAFEKDFIETTLEKNQQDREKTAALLGVKPAVLETKI